MRHQKTVILLELAKTLAGTAEGLTLDEMASHLGVDRRTAERLRDALRIVFPQLEEIQDGRQKRFRISGGLHGFIQAPTAEELAELDTAIRALDDAGGTARATLLKSLYGKIRAAQRASVRQRIEPDLEVLTLGQVAILQPGPRPLADPEVMRVLRQALLTGGTLRIVYRRPDGQVSARTVNPYGLLYGRNYFLVAPEAGHTEPVKWRVDRIVEAEVVDWFGGPPPEFDLNAYARQAFGAFHEEVRRIELLFDESVFESAMRYTFHPTQIMERAEGGRLRVTFEAGGLLEIAQHLMTWGGSVVVVEPQELRDVLLREVEAVRARYIPAEATVA